MVKLIDSGIPDTSFLAMEDGDIASITDWDKLQKYQGRIVQRVGDSLISLGFGRCESWPDAFNNSVLNSKSDSLRVKILGKGAKFQID